MSEHIFGSGREELSAHEVNRRRRIAQKHGADFIYARMPEGVRYWFTCESLGEPHDSRIAREVLEEIKEKTK